jgi:DNA-binding response OmpR family regulator
MARVSHNRQAASSLKGAGKRHVCRVLVVDDNEDIREMLAILLRLSGKEVDTAKDGLEAIRQSAFFTPDVVLLDIGLPNLQGHDVCREIRKRLGARPLIVAITGYGQPEDRRRSLDAGFDAHMVKPVDYDVLQKMVEDHCLSKHSRNSRRSA